MHKIILLLFFMCFAVMSYSFNSPAAQTPDATGDFDASMFESKTLPQPLTDVNNGYE